MRKSLTIMLTAAVVVSTLSVLAAMNNACKSERHTWCAYDLPHHAKTAHR